MEDEMGRCIAPMWEVRMALFFLSKNAKRSDHFGDLGIDVK
jgi:hypothetical protein